MKAIAQALGVSRSPVHERLKNASRSRGPYRKVDDAVVLPRITGLMSAGPAYGYQSINALFNRQNSQRGAAPINHKQVYRIMKTNHFLLPRRYGIRPEHCHEEKAVTLRSNLDW